MKETVIPVLINPLGTIPKDLTKRIIRVENQWKVSDYQNYGILKIGQNSEKSPGNLRRSAVTQTPVEDHQLMVAWKTHEE